MLSVLALHGSDLYTLLQFLLSFILYQDLGYMLYTEDLVGEFFLMYVEFGLSSLDEH